MLDGQQRLTSVFGVFQTLIEGKQEDGWLPVYFDHVAAEDAQEPQFVALPDDKVDPERHFPLKVLFSPSQYRAATSDLDDALALRLDEVQKRFLQATLPVQSFETEDQAEVAIVFERVNRLGIALDALQLLTAWSWSEEFHLQEQFSDLAEEVAEFGFEAIGQDPNLLLRCCAAVISGDASPSALVSLNGAVVRERFDEVKNGVQGAIDFVRRNLHVETLDNLPYSAALVPLSVLFAVKGNKQVKLESSTRKQILRWFWRACFSRRYSSGVLRSLKTDIAAMAKLREGEKATSGIFLPPQRVISLPKTPLFRVSSIRRPLSCFLHSKTQDLLCQAPRSTSARSCAITIATSFITCSPGHIYAMTLRAARSIA